MLGRRQMTRDLSGVLWNASSHRTNDPRDDQMDHSHKNTSLSSTCMDLRCKPICPWACLLLRGVPFDVRWDRHHSQ